MGDNPYSIFLTSNKSCKIKKKKIEKKNREKKKKNKNTILGKLSMAKTLHWLLLTECSNLL